MRVFMAAVLLFFVVPSFAADIKPWEGQYKPVSIRFDETDQLLENDAKSKMTLVVKDGEYRMFWQKDQSSDLYYRLFTADLKLDSASKTFSLLIKDGQKKGQEMHGIFEKSEFELKICYGPADKPRPTTFTAAKGSGYFLEVWAVNKK